MAYSRTSKLGIRTLALVIGLGIAALFSPTHADAADPTSDSYAMVNQARAAHGYGSLARNAGLDSMARDQAQRMADQDRIYHNPNLKSDADARGVNWTIIGENVGVGADVRKIHDAFMNSSGHKANVLFGEYNVIGVGVVNAKDGGVFVAHVFARVESAPAPAPAAPAPAPQLQQQPQQAPAATAPAAQVAGTSETPAPTTQSQPQPAQPSPSADPNALVGGIVNN